VEDLRITDPRAEGSPLRFTARPDVERLYQVPAVGFESDCDAARLRRGVSAPAFPEWRPRPRDRVPTWQEDPDPKRGKQRKLMRLLPLLCSARTADAAGVRAPRGSRLSR